jgi:hypothetical protein
MLTVLMETRNNEAEIAHSLAALVTGAVEGLVRDVVLLDHGSQDGSSRVADAAGARFCQNWDMAALVGAARGDWLLLLEPGARPIGRWVDDVAEYMALGRAPARFSPSPIDERSLVSKILSRASPLEFGLLLPRPQAVSMARSGMALEDFARARPIRKMRCELIPARVTTGARRAL